MRSIKPRGQGACIFALRSCLHWVLALGSFFVVGSDFLLVSRSRLEAEEAQPALEPVSGAVLIVASVDFVKNDFLTQPEGEYTHNALFIHNTLQRLTGDAKLLGRVKPVIAFFDASLLSRSAVSRDALEEYWHQRKALSPAAVVRALFTQDVLLVIRRELNRNAAARLDVQDVFNAIRDVLSKEALLEAGDISIKKSRKRRRRVTKTKTDASTGQAVTEEVEEEVDDPADDEGKEMGDESSKATA